MNSSELQTLTESVARISREVGEFLVHERSKFDGTSIEQKGVNNLVSHVDKEAEQQFVQALSALLPSAGFIAEEGTGAPSENGLNWIIDPLDGTTNFIHNIPFFCTSVALVQDREPLLGVIFDPVRNEMYAAYQGSKATLNGSPIGISPTTRLENMLMVTGFPYEDGGLLDSNLNTIADLTRQSRGIRRLGSAALDMCYVACGRFDGFYEYGLNAWDVAAGTCIVQQAGGIVNDFAGRNNPVFGAQIIAGSPAAYQELLSIVQKNFAL